MVFGVPNLLQLSQDDHEVKDLFIEMIHNFVRKNALQEVLLGQASCFVVRK